MGDVIKDNELIIRKIEISVPRIGKLTGDEGLKRLFQFLKSLDIDCEINESEKIISYGPNVEGAELDFLEGAISLFEARLLIARE